VAKYGGLLVFGFSRFLKFVTTGDCNTIANSQTLKFINIHTKSSRSAVFIITYLVTVLNAVDSSVSPLHGHQALLAAHLTTTLHGLNPLTLSESLSPLISTHCRQTLSQSRLLISGYSTDLIVGAWATLRMWFVTRILFFSVEHLQS
jgi:hypothetical protein